MKNSVTSRSMKLSSFFAMCFVAMFVGSCSESDDAPNNTSSRVPYQCMSCVKTSEALPENDNSSNGIYKGVFTNGSFELDVKNRSEDIKGVVFYNNKRIELFGVSSTYVKGNLMAVLRGALDGKKFSMNFWVSQDGSNPKVYDFSLPDGKAIVANVVKETSKTLQESFEGKYYIKTVVYPQSGNVPELEGKVDNPFPPAENITDKGAVRVLLSRTDAIWFFHAVLNGGEIRSDSGSIIDGKLVSDNTHKVVATLVSDELNHVDYSSGNSPMSLYAIRVR
ncbi:hypothetical protein [Flavobacterium suncheonense]|nr:hypothetical protein [Flavobacterium suncheonense]